MYGVELSLAQCGSGVVQVTPMAIVLEGLKNSFVIVEEPEINLHPDAHLRVVEWLVDLYRRGNVAMFFMTTHSPFVLSKLAHLYAKGLVKSLRMYLIQDDGRIRELCIDVKRGEVEIPQSILDAYGELARESLEFVGVKFS